MERAPNFKCCTARIRHAQIASANKCGVAAIPPISTGKRFFVIVFCPSRVYSMSRSGVRVSVIWVN